MTIPEKLAALPAESGVYLMLDEAGTIIYVGKARSLKNRVRQYFHAGNKTEKTLALVRNIADFRYIITGSEVEALVLENNLIKKYNPKYNILLKDDKSYPFIRINLNEPFPRVEVTRKLKNDGAKYFGPYMQGINIKDITGLIASAFPVRCCQHDLSKLPKTHRPCLNAHIGRCLAPCAGGVTEAEYHKMINEIIKFLRGNDKRVQSIIEDKMETASNREDFETAIFYRDKLRALEKLVRRQIAALPKDYNLDVFAVVDNGLYSAVSVLIVRGGKILGGDNYPLIGGVGIEEMKAYKEGRLHFEVEEIMSAEHVNMLEQFILQYYQQTPSFPEEIVVNITLSNEYALEKVLFDIFDKKINIVQPIQGVRKQMINMAENNALDYLDTFILKSIKKESVTRGAVRMLRETLGLETIPRRMECYDISHSSGTNMVASMVVFKDGEPSKSAYRRFKIKTVDGNNDFACMQEVIFRRLSRLRDNDADTSFGERPDLIIVDGGKGQLSYALDALHATGFEDLQIVSLAKREEEIYLPYRSEPVILDKNSVALQLLQRIRDEAHRFAITYHRQLRANAETSSELLKIKGIGQKKINILYAHFRSLDKIKAATKEELLAVKGISITDANAVIAHFKNNK